MPVTTGHGASLTFDTQSGTYQFTNIDLGEETVEDVDDSHLGTTERRTFRTGDLVDGGEITAGIQADLDDQPAVGKANETITITRPLSPAGQTAGTIAFEGYVNGWTRGNMVTDELIEGEISIKVSGPITWTAEVPTT